MARRGRTPVIEYRAIGAGLIREGAAQMLRRPASVRETLARPDGSRALVRTGFNAMADGKQVAVNPHIGV